MPNTAVSLQSVTSPLTLIGCGNMAGAMLERWLTAGLAPDQVKVVRPSGQAVADGITVVTDLLALAPLHGIVLLGFKPQQLAENAVAIAAALAPDAVLVSILAGITLTDLQTLFPERQLVRAMPNMPVRHGEGVVMLVGDQTPDVIKLMAALGHAQWLEDESNFDLYTALAGCGPAYVYRFIEAMAAAGTRLGLPPEEAMAITRAMMLGATASAYRSPLSPGELVAEVASKGGMTQAGLDVLDDDGKLVALLTDTLRAARDRGKELADLARSNTA